MESTPFNDSQVHVTYQCHRDENEMTRMLSVTMEIFQNSDENPTQLNQSWIGQLPFQIPPSIPTSSTADQTLPITIPPGYKIAQDSVTGQLIMIPSNDIGKKFVNIQLVSQWNKSEMKSNKNT